MPKTVTAIYTCSKCDAQHLKWLGQCATCGGWGTIALAAAPSPQAHALPTVDAVSIPTLDAIDATAVTARVPTGISEFDFAVGGGLVPGSVLLLAGEPGIGKSTLVLQVAAAVAHRGTVLYATGEETAAQLKVRAERTGTAVGPMRLLATTDGARVAAAIRALRPMLAIVDSVQTIGLPDLPTEPGGVTATRALVALLVETARAIGVPIAAVGHVTKDGAVAGPKTLEHLVDQVALLEGEPTSGLRVLRTTKNRYGPTDVVGVFTMTERGLTSNADPAAAFLSPTRERPPGTAITATVHGGRVLLAEVQALVTRSAVGIPQRRAVGVDLNRVHVLLAVIARHGGVPLATSDVHLATVGGLRITDPGADLAVALAIASAATGHPLPFDLAVGEIGLDGSIRSVSAIDRRLREAVRLGRTRIAAPSDAPEVPGATITRAATIAQLTGNVRRSPDQRLQSTI